MTKSTLNARRPFPGLRSFDRQDADWFFGREEQSFALYRLVDRGRLITVVGGSGSGKSSVVRAGLMRLLEEETSDRGGRKWAWWIMHPGDAPIVRLAEALSTPANRGVANLTPARPRRIEELLSGSSFGLVDAILEIGAEQGQCPLLVIDQFEELFRFADLTGTDTGRALRREQATRFVQLLLEAARNPSIPLRIVLTMRSDYLGDCARFEGLPQAVTMNQFLVPALNRRQREETIRGPVERAHGAIDTDLVEQLLEDSSEELDQLPVLAHCMMRLWQLSAPRLSLAGYEAIGGLHGALSRHADEIIAEPKLAHHAKVVEQVFRALSEVDRGRPVRRPLALERLIAETGFTNSEIRTVVNRLRRDDCCFLRPQRVDPIEPKTVIDITHEALVRHWDRVSSKTYSGEASRIDGHPASSPGWLWEEANDGNIYRALVTLVLGAKGATLPLDQVEQRYAWWSERTRTAAWAERYVNEPGGGLDRIQSMFALSLDALERHNKGIEEAERLRRDNEQLRLEQANERSRQEKDRRLEAERRLAEATARTRLRTMLNDSINALAIWDRYTIARLFKVLAAKPGEIESLTVTTLAEGAGIAVKPLLNLCQKASCHGELLVIKKDFIAFASATARGEAEEWSMSYFANLPFGCFVDLRNRSVLEFFGEGYIIGRGFQGSLSNNRISRAHMVVFKDIKNGAGEAIDLRSLNGTSVNGTPLTYGQHVSLHTGDVTVIANLVPFVFISVADFPAIAGLDYAEGNDRPFGVPRREQVAATWGYFIDAHGKNRPLQGRKHVVLSDGSLDGDGQPALRLEPAAPGFVLATILLANVYGIYRVKERDQFVEARLAQAAALHIPSSEISAASSEPHDSGVFRIGQTFFEVVARSVP